MKKRPILLGSLAFVAVAAVCAYAVWAVLAASRLGAGWAGLDTAWPYLLAGVITVGLAIAGFLRLAFYSHSHGYDDRVDIDQR
jgi:branched-subunit amino acid transport protein